MHANKTIVSFIFFANIFASASEKSDQVNVKELQVKKKETGLSLRQRGIYLLESGACVFNGTVAIAGGALITTVGILSTPLKTAPCYCQPDDKNDCVICTGCDDTCYYQTEPIEQMKFYWQRTLFVATTGCACCLVGCCWCKRAAENFKQAIETKPTMKRD